MKNISKIISVIFLILSIILFIYVFYRSEIFHLGTNLNFYLKYYIFSLLLIILSVISFFIERDLKIKITIVVTSTIISLYLVEGSLTFYKYLNSKNYRIKKVSIEYDTRDRYVIYQDLKKENSNIVVTMSPLIFIDEINQDIFPLSGISNRKTIFCNENGYYSIYQSDRYGFNNPNGEWDKKEIEYLLVGDSFTHGACVNEPDDISGNLKSMIDKKMGVLNLGYTGNSPITEYASLKEYFPTANVKRVLWIYYENDILVLKKELNNQILLNYLNNNKFTQNLKLRQKELDKKLIHRLLTKEEEKMKQNMVTYNNLYRERLSLRSFIKMSSIRLQIYKIVNSYFKQDPSLPFAEFKQTINLAKNFSESNGAKFYFIFFSDYRNYYNNLLINSEKHSRSRNHKMIIEIINNLNISIIDIHTEVLKNHKDPLSFYSKFPLLPFKPYGHYNELGYKVITNHIFNKIKEYESIN